MIRHAEPAGALDRLWRWVYLKDIDTVDKMRGRNDGFEALRDRIRYSGTDRLIDFRNGYTFEGGLSLQQNPDELSALCLFLKERGPFEHYMEIGSGSGGTCRFLHESVGFRRTLSLDDGKHARAGEQAENFRHVENFQQFLGDSHSEAACAFLTESLGRHKLDLAFIDGDHSYRGVRMDIELTLPFCREGTLLIFHDTVACAGVRKAWTKSIARKLVSPLAEYVGEEVPLGISVNAVL
jgi:predicted O-methyltransferase YrrM